MPNWVYNTLTVAGPADRLAAFAGRVSGPDETGADVPFTFQRIIPRPAEHDGDWYEWNTAHWGTKWDARNYEPDAGSGVSDGVSDGQLVYQFSTAWSYPEPVFARLAADFPDLSLTFEFQEEQGWGGTFEASGGKLTLTESYDVPTSHAEMVGRGGSCFCELDEPVFSDCWVFAARDAGVTDTGELEVIERLSVDWELSFGELLTSARAVCAAAADQPAASQEGRRVG